MKKNHAYIFTAVVISLIIVLAAVPASIQAKQKSARGIVFEDTNRNRILDKDEKGIPGVVVSNQFDAVRTDQNGKFRLPVENETIIFISKPAGYDLPLDQNNFPQFYHIHQPAGSPTGLKYPGIAPTGKLLDTIYFPLFKTDEGNAFEIIVSGDPQTANRQEIDFFRDSVAARLIGTKARFYLALGDIMYNDLSLYDQMNRVVGQIGIPVHHVMGNHDMNYDVPDYVHEAETFKRVHGPDYYSFNHGKVHFVVLNTVRYNGWNKEENKAGTYTGFLHQKQLTWLEKDLSFVPEDHLIVLSMHIPVFSTLYPEDDRNGIINRAEVFKILENRPHLLALAGHMHFFEYMEFTPQLGWNGTAVFPSITAGAACGTWWHGPLQPDGIPFGMCTDGTPNGYFTFSFNGNQYNYKFHPATPVPDNQLRINSPTGTLSPKDIAEGKIEINVNVFTGTPHTTVAFSLDTQPGITMEQKIMNDPFFAHLVETNKDRYIDWMEPTLSAHTWIAPLPAGIEPGIHRLKITVNDPHLGTYTAYRLFEVSSL